jgi:multiple antibiotic resistance protein
MLPMGIVSAAITLFLVMDPIGNTPVFLSVLEGVENPRRRRSIIVRELFIALGILFVFLFSGKYILSGLQIRPVALQMSGGIILFLIAIRMIFPRTGSVTTESAPDEPFIVPLAVPLVAGPSAMTAVVLFATQFPDRLLDWTLALTIAWAGSFVVLFFGEWLRRVLGARLIAALERLMGMILTVIATQTFLDGVATFLADL